MFRFFYFQKRNFIYPNQRFILLKNFITLVIIPQKTSRVIRLQISQLFIQSFIVFLIFFLIIAGFILFDYFDIKERYQNYKTLKQALMQQKVDFQKVNNQLFAYNKNIKKIQEFDHKLRVITGDQFLIQGLNKPLLSASKNDQNSLEFRYVLSRLRNLSYSIKRREASFLQLVSFMQESKDRLARIPSIPPVRDGYITSRYGKRLDPFTGRQRRHEGLDFAGRPYTPIYAPADGVVTGSFVNGGYGNFIVISHGYNITTRYAHLAKFEVKAGAKVKRGQLIGRMGNTGRSTGTHLHYEILIGDRPTDPEKYILE
ncbi:MAG: murein DD-endopeptidase MepM/ murein hydrolase activator NlpD [bacterium]|jgi:murein DD-endopeptidase MepM/ murein hydrolase activator NlpD